MGRFFVGLDGRPDQAATPLTEIFHLEDQLAAASHHRRRKRRIVSILSPDILQTLEGQAIELPSWAFGNSGTRFRVWTTAGTPRDPFEKIADAAEVNRVTALAPSVALHIPWDKVDDYDVLRRHAEDLGVALGHDQLEHVPGRGLQVRRAAPTRTTASAARRSTTTSSASTSWMPPARAT